MAIIDWYSRYVLNWALGTTLEADFCIDTLNETLEGKVVRFLIPIRAACLQHQGSRSPYWTRE
jgi:transposase InsO family protein